MSSDAVNTLEVTHTLGERIVVRATATGTDLFSYVYKPDPSGFEARKPYVHPLRTLSGNLVSGYRPNDHRWHKGLQMTASHLSGQNFWGGDCYVHGKGYLPLPDRIGSMRHDGFEAVDASGDELAFTEGLTWIENGGVEWAREKRGVRVHSVDTESGSYAIDWSIELTNTRADGEALHFGSPTTAGREMAGYTGLQWRGPRDFTGGTVLGPQGEASESGLMGSQAPWLAFAGEHDDIDAHSTLVFAHAPENAHAIHASHWFVRSEPIPTVAFSWAFFEEFALPAGERFRYRYRIVVADGAWDRERVVARLKGLAW
ncbi:PmoA family protein [Streptomyces atroolivaceus]|uniref:PmoA family protein n=1 Tax=Streptomyces atroolivaceus TaxID=66869 RepID=A0ABV9VGW9_STRAZ|nr:PmoA family protein [Streptomyces atroolivaceus]